MFDKKWFDKFKIIWTVLVIEYSTSFACGFLGMMGRIEEHHSFNFLYAYVLIQIELHFHLVGDWLEHFCFKDLSASCKYSLSWEGIIYNMPTYIGQVVAIPVVLLANSYLLQGQYMREGYSVS